MSFTTERERISSALQQAGVLNVGYSKDYLPQRFPAAIVTLESEDGILPTAHRFTDTRLSWAVFLVVNATNAADPDTALYALKETFRQAYIALKGKDLAHIEYYTSKIDGARTVRVAKLSLGKGGGA